MKRTSIREQVYNMCDGHCYYCGKKLVVGTNNKNSLSIDHIVPRDHGGVNKIHNYLPSCKSCNSSKGTKTLIEFKQFLARRKRFGPDIVFSDKHVEWLENNGFDLGIKVEPFFGESYFIVSDDYNEQRTDIEAMIKRKAMAERRSKIWHERYDKECFDPITGQCI